VELRSALWRRFRRVGSSEQIPAKADPNWTGAYIGAHAGYGWADWDGKLETTAGNPPNKDAGFANPYQTLSDEGFIGGGQIGYNSQIGSFLIGVEGDFSWGDIVATGTFDTMGYNPPANSTSLWSKKHDLSLD